MRFRVWGFGVGVRVLGFVKGLGSVARTSAHEMGMLGLRFEFGVRVFGLQWLRPRARTLEDCLLVLTL